MTTSTLAARTRSVTLRSRSSEQAPRPPADTTSWSVGAVAAASIAAVLVLQGLTYLLFWPHQNTDSTLVKPALAVIADTPGGVNASQLYDALQAGPTSPRGRAANTVSPQRALELANASLFGTGSARDTEEAAFWLKRYLASAFADDRTRRVLTQLGTTYASPTRGAPSYTTARQIWDLAAAVGDAQAMCFLAVLEESGLDKADHRPSASQWRARARDLGGCPQSSGIAAP